MQTSFFEPKPRWPGAPLLCRYENLPALPDEAELRAFNESCGGHSITEKWLCTVCAHWHYLAAPRGPSGASSGTSRVYRQPVPRYRREQGRVQPVDDEICENSN